jgi:hypothetical protein
MLFTRPASATDTIDNFGCNIDSDDLHNASVGNAPPSDLEASTVIEIYGKSGNDTFDSSLGSLLAQMSRDFSVQPGFAYYNDTGRMNAKASPETRIGSQRGTVLLGLSLLKALLARQHGDIAVAAICAHEFGHVYQFESGMIDRLKLELPTHGKELHADFLSGWFLAKLESERRGIKLFEAGRYVESIGSTKFDSRDFHGTPKQRKKYIESGYSYWRSQPSSLIADAADSGFTRVCDELC